MAELKSEIKSILKKQFEIQINNQFKGQQEKIDEKIAKLNTKILGLHLEQINVVYKCNGQCILMNLTEDDDLKDSCTMNQLFGYGKGKEHVVGEWRLSEELLDVTIRVWFDR